jgi:hypothetical protein
MKLPYFHPEQVVKKTQLPSLEEKTDPNFQVDKRRHSCKISSLKQIRSGLCRVSDQKGCSTCEVERSFFINSFRV